MKRFSAVVALFIILSHSGYLYSQDKPPVKFGKIVPTDFDLSGHHFDTSVSAVVIADVGISYFEGNYKGWFTLMHKRQKRVKILNKNGFDAANVEVLLYSKDQSEEKLDDLKAYTYNLENGKVIETRLDNAAVFKEKISKNIVRRKFTFPAVKEGSIVEYSYTVSSDFLFNLQPWTFQGEYPCLWSDYEVDLPEFFNYVSLSQGYNPYFIKSSKNSIHTFSVTQSIDNLSASTERFTISGNVTQARWVMKDVPALKEEKFTSTIRNHVSKIEFQLSQYRFPDMPVKDIMGNWNTVNDELLKDENFGVAINGENNWLDTDMKTMEAENISTLEKARGIFSYVRDHFTCTDYSDVFLNSPLKTIYKNRNGSVADINLLLVAMLRHAHINADPVLLSTREHGVANELYPLMDRFNYVIATARIDGAVYYLDATRPVLGFGKLPEDCFNGTARIVGKEPGFIYLDADSLQERKLTTVFIVNNDKGESEGVYQSLLGYIESYNLRTKIKEKGEESYFKKIRAANSFETNVQEASIDSLTMLENPVKVRYNFSMNKFDEDIIYFDPVMGEGYKENLFKSAERNYLVEMPYTTDETFILNMEIPKGYVIDEMPKSAKVNFNDGEGTFEYMIGTSGESIQLRTRLVIKRANFKPDEYNTLRDFYGYIVKKHSEQIVFKKKKV